MSLFGYDRGLGKYTRARPWRTTKSSARRRARVVRYKGLSDLSKGIPYILEAGFTINSNTGSTNLTLYTGSGPTSLGTRNAIAYSDFLLQNDQYSNLQSMYDECKIVNVSLEVVCGSNIGLWGGVYPPFYFASFPDIAYSSILTNWPFDDHSNTFVIPLVASGSNTVAKKTWKLPAIDTNNGYAVGKWCKFNGIGSLSTGTTGCIGYSVHPCGSNLTAGSSIPIFYIRARMLILLRKTHA